MKRSIYSQTTLKDTIWNIQHYYCFKQVFELEDYRHYTGMKQRYQAINMENFISTLHGVKQNQDQHVKQLRQKAVTEQCLSLALSQLNYYQKQKRTLRVNGFQLIKLEQALLKKKNFTNRYFKAVGTQLNINKPLISHAARHTYISNLINANVPYTTIAKLVGHDTTEMIIKVYAHPINNKKKNSNQWKISIYNLILNSKSIAQLIAQTIA